jgi:hypothetical protein
MPTNEQLQALVQQFADDSGADVIPMATTDSEEVIKSQLTENTGQHFLDSGGACGRHWEDNQDNPPWEQSAWEVGRDHVTHNVYHYMDRVFDRDRLCVALEAALYAFSYSPNMESESWLTCMEDFAESIGDVYPQDLEELGVPTPFAELVGGFYPDEQEAVFSHLTYNSECHGLSQHLQGTNFGGPYAEYTMLQVHGGCDIRGGYTAPRVYSTFDGWFPHELQFDCEQCGWNGAESCIYGSDELLYQREIDEQELHDEWGLPTGKEHPALESARQSEGISGAVFHRCEEQPGHFGHVRFM